MDARRTDSRSALRGWAPLLLGPPLAFALLPAGAPRWVVMWTVSVAIFAGCKWLTWRRAAATDASIGRRIGYLIAWPGLDADAFLSQKRANVERPTRGEWLFAAAKLLVGVALVAGSARLVLQFDPWRVGWAGMAGIVFTLHFGLFHLLSCGWRAAGVAAVPLMDWPILSRSVSEFWGQRWNRAFRDLTHRYLFRPLAARIGPQGALASAFLFSGVVHEVVITVPAGGGYGQPTLYFLVQAVALLVERRPAFRRLVLTGGGRGWIWTLLVTVLPVGWLFPHSFVVGIVVPFLAFLDSLP